MATLSVLEELRAPRPKSCMLCRWLATRPADERAEWAEAMADGDIERRRIVRAMQARGFTGTKDPLYTHIRAGHA